MNITAIKAQVKNPERVSVYVDGSYAFSLNHQQLLDQRLRVGLELDHDRLAALKRASEFGKAYERVLNYIMIRPRSRKELEDYCWRKRYDPADAQAVIEKLASKGYVNDEAFARAWVESRRLTKNISLRRLRLELQQKGVHDSAIVAALTEGDYNEMYALTTLVAKKRMQSRYQDEQKLMLYLIRQGFTYDAVKTALHPPEE